MKWRRPVRAWALAVLLLPMLARGETLLDVYKLAHENDPKFRAAQAEFRASGTLVDQARAGLLPTVRFDIERMDTDQRIISSRNPIFGPGSTSFATDTETLSITQPIFRKDVIERFRQSKLVVKQAEYMMLAAEQELQLRTAVAYLVVLAAADNLELARAEREAVGKALDLARQRLKAGLGTIVGEYDATARYAVSQAREFEARNRLRDAQQGLREITGREIKVVQTLRDTFPLELPQPASVERWLETAFEQNLLLLARREAVEVAEREISRQQAGYYPSLNLVINRNKRDAGSTLFGGGSNVETTEMSLRLSVPIYEGGMTKATTQEAVYRHEKVKEDLEQERRGVDRLTRAAFDGVVTGVSLVDALRKTVVAQESALKAREQGYQAGLIPLLPVLDAQRDLFLARRDYEQTRYDYLFNRLRLKQAAGTLSEDDLLHVNAALK